MRTAGGCHRDGASTLDVLIKRLQERQARVEALRAMLAALPAFDVRRQRAGTRASNREKLADWRGLLTRNVESGREVLRALLVEPLRFTPVVDERRRGYRFTGAVALDRLVSGVIELPTPSVESQAGFEPAFQP